VEHLQKLNWALFLGCCVVAISIFAAGQAIANRLPHTMHGNFSGSLTSHASFDSSDREFMSDWQAAAFIGMSWEEFESIVESGELSGTYTAFQVERQVWRRWEDTTEWIIEDPTIPARPIPMEYDIVTVDHRVFSRERLAEWLLSRMD